MRNILKVSLIALAVGAFTPVAVHAYEDEQEEDYAEEEQEDCLYSVTGVSYNDVLNIRAWPSPKSRIVGYMPPNAEGVEVARTKGNWGLVTYDGIEGWSYMGYLESTCD